MSRFFPHAQYAEDQPLAKTILTVHNLHRGAQTGTTIGMASASVIALLKRRNASAKANSAPSLVSTYPAAKRMLPSTLHILERSAGRGAIIGLVSMVVVTPIYMKGKDDIEWKDRSWRLLANDGQVEVDSWSLGGATIGLASLLGKGTVERSWRSVVGRTAMGSMTGVLGYMITKYGLRRDSIS